MGNAEIEAFLTHLAVEGQVSASTQNPALSALLFLYRKVLNLEMSGIDAVRAKRPQYVPTVLTKQEAIAVLQQCDGIYQLVVKLLYGSGLRLIEGLRLRVKDVDFAQQQIVGGVQKAVKQAARAVKLTKRIGCHTFRHSFATHLGTRMSRPQ
jgi:integrase